LQTRKNQYIKGTPGARDEKLRERTKEEYFNELHTLNLCSSLKYPSKDGEAIK